MPHRTGISNRETPDEEARGREQHPPLDPSAPPPEDASGRVGDEPLGDTNGRHTSHTAGAKSIAQKEEDEARKVAGAFGRERGPAERDVAASSKSKHRS